MNGLKLFLVRLLQVVWVVSFIVLLINLTNYFDLDVFSDFFIGIALWSGFLVIVQYLLFSSTNPLFPFVINLEEEAKRRRAVVIVSIAVVSTVIAGSIGLFKSNAANQEQPILESLTQLQEDAVELPLSVVSAYNNGDMTNKAEAELEEDVENGLVYAPTNFPLIKKDD